MAINFQPLGAAGRSNYWGGRWGLAALVAMILTVIIGVLASGSAAYALVELVMAVVVGMWLFRTIRGKQNATVRRMESFARANGWRYVTDQSQLAAGEADWVGQMGGSKLLYCLLGTINGEQFSYGCLIYTDGA